MNHVGCVSVCFLAVGLWLTACSPQQHGQHAETNPAAQAPSGAVAKVFIFVNNDCPIANRYAPEIRRLHQLYAPRGIAFCLVHSDPQETQASVRDHDREYGLNLPVLMDPDQSMARRSQAEVVPTAAVISATGQLVYHGRIDDRFADIGRERLEPSRHDLAEALNDVLAHRPVKISATKAIGCYLPHSR